jgi:alpha-L-fucosidase 2
LVLDREAFCSYPDNVCVYRVNATSLPQVTVGLENQLVPQSPTITCQGNSINLFGLTAPGIGLIYNARATVTVPGATGGFCSNGQIVVPKGYSEVIVVIAAGTDYDASNGNVAASFSFKGADPSEDVLKTATQASKKSYSSLKNAHIKDYSALFNGFTLTLPDPKGSFNVSTADLFTNYVQPGDPYVEGLLFDYGRYLFIASSRPGSLPPNLQGIWTEQYSPGWSADYHANINLQMNHWTVDQTGLGDQTGPLWSYMADTWMPRGSEIAYLLYGANEGWTTHNQMNTFGYTA